MKKVYVENKFIIIILLLLLGFSISLSLTTDMQWDFRTYYFAGQAYASETNPYDSKVLSQLSGVKMFDFTYPPLTLAFFYLFSLLPYKVAYYVYLGIKLLLWVGLVKLWSRIFLEDKTDLGFWVFAITAFNCAFLGDILAGNISLFEQLFIWLAFSFYLKRRLFLFSLLIVIVALFKITPLFFLLLLLFLPGKKKYMLFLGSVLSFSMIMLLQYILSPEMFNSFLNNMSKLSGFEYERGFVNPAQWPLINDVTALIKSNIGLVIPIYTEKLVFVSIVFSIILITWWYLSKSQKALTKGSKQEAYNNDKVLIFIMCLGYVLILPRFKNYSYILLIPPAYYMIKSIKNKRLSIGLFFISIIPTFGLTALGKPLILQYYPLLLTYLYWLLYIIMFKYFTFER